MGFLVSSEKKGWVLLHTQAKGNVTLYLPFVQHLHK